MKTYSESIKEYARGLAGGLLFSLPMIYTMEVWWTGFIVSPGGLMLYVLSTFLLLIGYNRFAGMRKDATYKEVLVDSVEELALGLILSFFILWVLNIITPGDMPHEEVIGKVIMEAMAVAIGISIGTAQLGESRESAVGVKGDDDKKNGVLSHLVMSLCGAVLIGANLAATEEIVMIAVDLSIEQMILLFLFSLLLTGLISYYIDFANTKELPDHGRSWRIIGGTAATYTAALLASTFMLWFFNAFNENNFFTSVAAILTLGVGTSLGASAGRLLLKGSS